MINQNINTFKNLNFTRKDKIILIIMIIVDLLNDSFYTIFDERINPSNGSFAWLNILLICTLIFSFFYSNQIYYKHRLLSLFIIIALTSIVDV